VKYERKDKPYFGVKIFKDKYPDRNGRDIELSVCTNANYWVGLPNMNIQDLKELRKSIRKYIKNHEQ
jgi:hypothetical protein